MLGLATIPVCAVYCVRTAIYKLAELIANGLQHRASRLRTRYFKTHPKVQDFLLGIKAVVKQYDYALPTQEAAVDQYSMIVNAIEKLKSKMGVKKESDKLDCDESDALIDEVLNEIKLKSWKGMTKREKRWLLVKVRDMLFYSR